MSHSAAFLDGIPNTVAGPERKETIPILSSAGFAWPAATAEGAANSAAAARAEARPRMARRPPNLPWCARDLRIFSPPVNVYVLRRRRSRVRRWAPAADDAAR